MVLRRPAAAGRTEAGAQRALLSVRVLSRMRSDLRRRRAPLQGCAPQCRRAPRRCALELGERRPHLLPVNHRGDSMTAFAAKAHRLRLVEDPAPPNAPAARGPQRVGDDADLLDAYSRAVVQVADAASP